MVSPVTFDDLVAERGRVQAQQMFMVAEGLRAACRLRVARDELPPLARAASRLSLKMLVGFDAVAVKRVEGRAGFGEWGRRELLSPHRRGDCYVYLCRDHIHGQRLRRYDEAGDDAVVGELLGYPGCCIRAFEDLAGRATGFDPVILSYGDDRPIDWPMNVSLLCFGLTLLSHVPCTPDCSASKEIAGRYYDFLSALRPAAAAELRMMLSTRVLHTQALGIAAFTARERDTGLEVEEVWVVDPESVLGELLCCGSSVVRETDGVIVDGCFLAGSEVRLFEFS
jgi:hypothetical protein